jgi:hypothetical protein
MQGGVDDPAVAEAEHEEHVMLAHPGLAGEETGIAVERDAGRRDGGLVVWRGDDRFGLAIERRPDGAAAARQRRPSTSRVDGAERDVRRLRQRRRKHMDRAVRPIRRPAGLLGRGEDAKRRRDTGRPGMAFEHAGIAHDQRPADRPHLRIEGRLQADLGSDARGIAGGDGDAGECFGGGICQDRIRPAGVRLQSHPMGLT